MSYAFNVVRMNKYYDRFFTLYDPSTELWTNTDSMLQVHLWHTVSILTNGKVLVSSASSNNIIVNVSATSSIKQLNFVFKSEIKHIFDQYNLISSIKQCTSLIHCPNYFRLLSLYGLFSSYTISKSKNEITCTNTLD